MERVMAFLSALSDGFKALFSLPFCAEVQEEMDLDEAREEKCSSLPPGNLLGG